MKLHACVTGAILLASAGALHADETVKMNVSTFVPENHPLAKYSYTEWLPRLKEATGGTVDYQLFSSSSLVGAAAHLSGVRDGIVQVGFVAGTYTPSDLPADNTLAQLSFNLSDSYAAAFAMTEANFTMPQLAEQWSNFDIVYLGGYSTATYNLICKGTVTDLASIRGKKVRAPGAAYSDWIDSVGGVPVNVPTSEMYSGLDKGILDCAVVPADEVKSRSLNEVTDSVTMIDLGVYAAGAKYAINGDFWKSLSDGQRQAFVDTIPQGIVDELQYYGQQVQNALDAAGELGIAVHEPDADLLASVEEFKAAANSLAVEAGKTKFNIENPEALVSDFSAIYAKWVGLLEGVDRQDDAALVGLLNQHVFNNVDVSTYGL